MRWYCEDNRSREVPVPLFHGARHSASEKGDRHRRRTENSGKSRFVTEPVPIFGLPAYSLGNKDNNDNNDNEEERPTVCCPFLSISFLRSTFPLARTFVLFFVTFVVFCFRETPLAAAWCFFLLLSRSP